MLGELVCDRLTMKLQEQSQQLGSLKALITSKNL